MSGTGRLRHAPQIPTFLARRAPDGLPEAPAQRGKAIPAAAGSTGMMNPLSCPHPLFPHGYGAVPPCSRLSEFPKRIWKAAGSCQRCRAPAAFPGCAILEGILGMGHFITRMRARGTPAAPAALPGSSPRAGKEREVLVFQRLQSHPCGWGVSVMCDRRFVGKRRREREEDIGVGQTSGRICYSLVFHREFSVHGRTPDSDGMGWDELGQCQHLIGLCWVLPSLAAPGHT